MYVDIALPPSEVGGSQLTAADPEVAVAVTDRGAPGTVMGTVGLETADGRDVPAALVAVTEIRYDTPLVRPVIVQEVDQDRSDVHDCPPGLATARYEVILEPPSDSGSSHETSTVPSPGAVSTDRGSEGGPTGVIRDEDREEGDVPIEFVAVTVNE